MFNNERGPYSFCFRIEKKNVFFSILKPVTRYLGHNISNFCSLGQFSLKLLSMSKIRISD